MFSEKNEVKETFFAFLSDAYSGIRISSAQPVLTSQIEHLHGLN